MVDEKMTYMKIGWNLFVWRGGSLKAHLLIRSNHITYISDEYNSSQIPTHFFAEHDVCYVVMTPFSGGCFLWISRPSRVDSAIGAPNAVVKCATLGWAGRGSAAKPMIAPKKKNAQASGVGKWQMWWWSMGCFCFLHFFQWSWSQFLRWNVGTLRLLVWKKSGWQELQQLGISIFNRTGRSSGKTVHLEPLHDSESSSYHDDILKGRLVVLLCHGCDMCFIAILIFWGERSPGHGVAFLVALGIVRDFPVEINNFLVRLQSLLADWSVGTAAGVPVLLRCWKSLTGLLQIRRRWVFYSISEVRWRVGFWMFLVPTQKPSNNSQ